ncbi:MAG TPA: PIG-L family deacetylase [Mycobacteriales bacterium]|nr:PIG-L family deacetylase [Mycobacteriales bacterium]
MQLAVRVAQTVVVFHAHPDDEALLTAGTMAKAASEGHRVVLVVATDGGAGLSADAGADLAGRRRAELHASARALGCARVEFLGYQDSGPDGSAPGNAFARADVEEAARRMADLLVAERADVLTSYDVTGGYGHPDHRQVHRVGARAATLAGTPVLLEATVDRTRLLRAVRVLRLVPGLPADLTAPRLRTAYAPRHLLTHRIDVSAFTGAKRAAMAAHASQATGGSAARTLAVFLRLPRPLFRRVFGYEWYVEVGRSPARPLIDSIFAGTGR